MADELLTWAPNELIEFIPQSFGNRSRQNPIKVWIRSPTERVKARILTLGRKLSVVNDDGNTRYEFKEDGSWSDQQRDSAAIVVERVKNYAPRGVQITNGREFGDHAETEIVAEVFTEVWEHTVVSHEVEKKHERQSVCLEPKTSQLSGIARNAEITG